MQFTLSAAVSISVKYLRLREGVYQFHRRVPNDLAERFGTTTIRRSLRTADPAEATRLCEELAREYDEEFSSLRKNSDATAADVIDTAKGIVQKYDLETFVDKVAEPLRERHGKVYGEEAYNSDPVDAYLQPHQVEALRRLQERDSDPGAIRLSDAFKIYLQQHPRGDDAAFKKKQQRDWDVLIDTVEDIKFDSLSRSHAREVIKRLQEKQLKTSTIRRTLNTMVAVINATLTEREIHRTNPFADLRIPGAGKDTKQRKSLTTAELTEIAEAMTRDMSSATSLITLLQMELGSRIGEVSGLSVDDLYLEDEIPHLHFREHPWRSLKTASSDRRVPLVGVALAAAKAALKLPRTGNGLFPSYAKARGADLASAAVNKRLQKWGLTSHDFRHAMKDRLRDAGCTQDIRDAIQGHAHGGVAETYGRGHTLNTMREWLEKVKISVNY